MLPHVGGQDVDAVPRKLTNASATMTPATRKVAATMIGPTGVGQDVPVMIRQSDDAHGARGVDELLLADGQEQTAHQARDAQPAQ